MKTLKEIEMTKLDKCYLIIYAFKTKIYLKKEDGIIEYKDLYVLVGLNCQGNRKYLGSYVDNKANHRFWLDVFESLKSKGMIDVIFLASDNNEYLRKCIKVSYPNVITMPLLLEITEAFYKYFSDKFSTKIRTEIKRIYTCKNVDEYKNYLEVFKEKYKDNNILQLLTNKYLVNIDNVYIFDEKIRKTLFNNYSLLMFKNYIDRVTKNNTYFENKDDIINLTIDYINNLENYKSYTKKEWLLVLNSFYDIFKERIEMYL